MIYPIKGSYLPLEGSISKKRTSDITLSNPSIWISTGAQISPRTICCIAVSQSISLIDLIFPNLFFHALGKTRFAASVSTRATQLITDLGSTK
jgi:hypothetical protein